LQQSVLGTARISALLLAVALSLALGLAAGADGMENLYSQAAEELRGR